jgi:hypothetical protein
MGGSQPHPRVQSDITCRRIADHARADVYYEPIFASYAKPQLKPHQVLLVFEVNFIVEVIVVPIFTQEVVVTKSKVLFSFCRVCWNTILELFFIRAVINNQCHDHFNANIVASAFCLNAKYLPTLRQFLLGMVL